MSADFWNGILAEHAAATLAATCATYRGWAIDSDFLDHWRAVHPKFDGESNTVQLTGSTILSLLSEIDAWIEENEVLS